MQNEQDYLQHDQEENHNVTWEVETNMVELPEWAYKQGQNENV